MASPPPSSRLSVLRVGPVRDDGGVDVCWASELREALVRHFGDADERKEDGGSGAPSSAPASAKAQERNTLTVSNKYFTAKVWLGDMGASHGGDAVLAEDGMVLVFDDRPGASSPFAPSSATTFDSLPQVHERAVERGQAGDLLRLCVGVRAGGEERDAGGREHEDEYARRVLWCLDRGYEYVAADLSDGGVSRGHDERDKDGFARIVEAVSGTVWSSAVMKARKQEELKQSYREAAHGMVDEKNEKPAVDGENAYEPPDPSKLPPVGGAAEDGDREEKAREALLQQDGVDDAYLEKPADEATAARRREEQKQERALDSLEGSLREANRLRELSRSGSMTDEERRKRAGDAAVLLMDMMGKMGFDESSSDDEEERSKEGKTE